MGIFDVFKKKESVSSDLGLSRDEGFGSDFGLGEETGLPPIRNEESPMYSAPSTLPARESLRMNDMPNVPMPAKTTPGVTSRDIDMISAKLDAINAKLENLSVRIANIEKIASSEEKSRPEW